MGQVFFYTWILLEVLRLAMGIRGNLQERVPEMSVFVFINVPQLSLLCYRILTEQPHLPWDKFTSAILVTFVVVETIMGYMTLNSFITNLTSRFAVEYALDDHKGLTALDFQQYKDEFSEYDRLLEEHPQHFEKMKSKAEKDAQRLEKLRVLNARAQKDKSRQIKEAEYQKRKAQRDAERQQMIQSIEMAQRASEGLPPGGAGAAVRSLRSRPGAVRSKQRMRSGAAPPESGQGGEVVEMGEIRRGSSAMGNADYTDDSDDGDANPLLGGLR